MGSNDASPVVSCDILGSGIVDDQSAVPSGKRESDLQAEVDVGAHILQPRVSDADILCETKNEMHYPTSSGHPTTLQQSNPNLENSSQDRSGQQAGCSDSDSQDALAPNRIPRKGRSKRPEFSFARVRAGASNWAGRVDGASAPESPDAGGTQPVQGGLSGGQWSPLHGWERTRRPNSFHGSIGHEPQQGAGGSGRSLAGTCEQALQALEELQREADESQRQTALADAEVAAVAMVLAQKQAVATKARQEVRLTGVELKRLREGMAEETQPSPKSQRRHKRS